MTKVVRINKAVTPTGCAVEKVSLAECKKILNANGIEYTDEEVNIIREYIYHLAAINYLYYVEKIQEQNQQENETKIINLTNNTNNETQSHLICTSEYRRTS